MPIMTTQHWQAVLPSRVAERSNKRTTRRRASGFPSAVIDLRLTGGGLFFGGNYGS